MQFHEAAYTKAHPGSDDAIDLLNRDLWLGALFLQGRRHASLHQSPKLAEEAKLLETAGK